MMDDEEVDFSSQLLLSNPNISSDFDEFLRSTKTCTHTHTCNPPGPDTSGHSHTCYHTHTRVFATGSEGEEEEEDAKKSRKPLGNREAVRKYREKKKAHAAYLEEEVKKLRLLNQQLLRRLQGQAALEAEVVRLRALLADLRGKIDTELGAFPFQKQCNNSGFRCNADIPCVGGDPAMVAWDEGGCEPAIVDCRVEKNSDMDQNLEMGAVNSMGVAGTLVSSASQAE